MSIDDADDDDPDKPLEFWKAVAIMQIDLPDSIRRDLLRPEALAGMLKNCEQCFHLRACTAWQSGHRPGDTPGVPDFCPNQKALESLAATSPAGRVGIFKRPGFLH